MSMLIIKQREREQERGGERGRKRGKEKQGGWDEGKEESLRGLIIALFVMSIQLT